MIVRYLVDSDLIISYLHGQPQVISRLDELKESGLAISVVPLAELFAGIYYSTVLTAVDSTAASGSAACRAPARSPA